MTKKRTMLALGLAALLVVAGWVGCGDDATAPSGDISEPQAEQVGGVIAEQVILLADAFTFQGFDDLPFEKATAMVPKDSPWRHQLLADRLWQYRLLADSCVSWTDTTDTDADGVPDDLIVRFDGVGCTESNERGTVQLSGSFRISDPGVDPGFSIAYSNVRLRADDLEGNYLEFHLNGTQSVTADPTTATLNENISLGVSGRDGSVTQTATLSKNWTASFAAAEGQSFVIDAPLPDGELTLNGSTSWQAGGDNWAFTLNTQSPLQHESACETPPTFDSGELRALVVGNDGGAFIRVQFVGCGVEPIVTLVGQPAN